MNVAHSLAESIPASFAPSTIEDDARAIYGVVSRGGRTQATQNDTIATFHAAGRVVEAVAALARADGRLIVGSSANTAGTGNNASFDDVPASIRRNVDLALDRGEAWYANARRDATTILHLPSRSFLRKGVNFAAIERSWQALCAAS